MNKRLLLQRSLDKKFSKIKENEEILPPAMGWISTIRRALGMTTKQLAKRLGVNQSRVSKMELNENNLKICTLQKIAEAMNCKLIYYFEPESSFAKIVENQAIIKADELVSSINLNMALENQEITKEEIIADTVQDFIQQNTKRIWE